MSTHALRQAGRPAVARLPISSHWAWLAGGIVLAFAVPFVFADLLEVHRDLYYGLYAAFVAGLLFAWARGTGYDLVAATRRHWPAALVLGAAAGAVLSLVVLRSEEATARPEGVELAGAVLWRGVVYGLADGLLLSVFPILAVFAAFAGSRFDRRLVGKVAIGVVALAASLAFTAAYHAGYTDFRSQEIAKPVAGDVAWSVPTLATLNPIGSPVAHAAMHTTAVLHSYETDTFLPPHR